MWINCKCVGLQRRDCIVAIVIVQTMSTTRGRLLLLYGSAVVVFVNLRHTKRRKILNNFRYGSQQAIDTNKAWELGLRCEFVRGAALATQCQFSSKRVGFTIEGQLSARNRRPACASTDVTMARNGSIYFLCPVYLWCRLRC